MALRTNNDFLPFGAQYYRYPTPLPESWESDLRNIRECGFNTIKIWAQWRRNNPQKGVYDFSDLQRLLDIAAENSLKVDINLIMDVTPVWFNQEYPDSYMVFSNGNQLLPCPTEYRQIGGAPGPCYNHPQAIHYKRLFVEKMAETFVGHPALRMYDLWNEPELTCGLARHPEAPMTCYCPHCQAAFREWLKDKYKSIEALNASWQRCYNNFDEVEAPKCPRTYNDMMDWRIFFSQTLTKDLQMRIDAVRKFDKATPVMVHTVPFPVFSMINACADDYQLAKICDGFGNSASIEMFPATISVCVAKNKPVMSAEIPALCGETFNQPGYITYNDFKRCIFVPLSVGVKGFLFWQYRCELLGRESPAWGLTDLAGNSTSYLESACRINDYLQEHRDFVMNAYPHPAEIAVIKDISNELFAWCANATIDKYSRTLQGAFYGFCDNNYRTDIINTEQLLSEDISQYKLLYYPLPYYMSEKVAARLKKWVADGGTLISECFFGGYRAECGLHSLKIPGYGFDEVFGAEGGISTSTSCFIDAYGSSWSQDDNNSLVSMCYTASNGSSYNVPGYFFCEELKETEAERIGSFPDGRGAMTIHRYGKGLAIMTGILAGGGYNVTRSVESRFFFDDLARRAGVSRLAEASQPDILVGTLEYDGHVMVILNNKGGYTGPVRIKLLSSIPQDSIMKDMDSGVNCPVVSTENGVFFDYQIEAGSISVLLSE